MIQNKTYASYIHSTCSNIECFPGKRKNEQMKIQPAIENIMMSAQNADQINTKNENNTQKNHKHIRIYSNVQKLSTHCESFLTNFSANLLLRYVNFNNFN